MRVGEIRRMIKEDIKLKVADEMKYVPLLHSVAENPRNTIHFRLMKLL